MPAAENLVGRFPKVLPASTGSSVSYKLNSRYFAFDGQTIYGETAGTLQSNGHTITIYPISVLVDLPGERHCHVLPVYELNPSGDLAVATGLIYIRFAQGSSVDLRLSAVRRVGYRISKRLSYTKDSYWVQSLSGDPAYALSHIPDLEAMSDVLHVEPQMLLRMHHR